MTQEEKELLLKDLCARLPYGVKIQECTLWYEEGKEVWKYRDVDLSINNINCINIDFIKPYLFPLSSMTEEREAEYNDLNNCELGWFPSTEDAFDYLVANHFDYRGLIEKGLAIDATGLNIY